MKAIVFSDSHGRLDNIKEVLRLHSDHEAVFHLGDSQGDEERLKRLTPYPVYMVRGNCDYYSSPCKDSLLIEWGGKRIAMCHGHRQIGYGGGLDGLYVFGRSQEADIVMFGHTHRPLLEEAEGMIFLNPGSISNPRQENKIPTYAIINVDVDGNMTFEICDFTPVNN